MSKGTITPKQLKAHERFVLWIGVLLLRVWFRSLRFRWGGDVQDLMDRPSAPAVVIVWHNRLFPSPEFFRRYFKTRKLATIISASSDGGWLAGLFEHFGMLPIRGSRHGRGAQAFRELVAAIEEGYDVGVTPDGSRGPMYEMKAGAVALALKTESPIVILSYNYTKAWRLKSWDRFYLPMPFSRINVKAVRYETPGEVGQTDPKLAALVLKERLDAITEDI